MSISREDAISAATSRLQSLTLKYDRSLVKTAARITGLVRAGRRKEAMIQCHNLKGEAATFGWHSITRHAEQLRDLLAKPSSPKREQMIEVGLKSLQLLAQLPMKNERELCQDLVDKFSSALLVVDRGETASARQPTTR